MGKERNRSLKNKEVLKKFNSRKVLFRAVSLTSCWDGVCEASEQQQGIQAHVGEKSHMPMAQQRDGLSGETAMEEAAAS